MISTASCAPPRVRDMRDARQAQDAREVQQVQQAREAPLDIARVEHSVPTRERERRSGHRGGVFWLTGFSGAGKSTLAIALEQALFARGYLAYVLDGDNLRHGLNADLGFTHADRTENIRRVGEVAALFADAGFVCISAFISPYRADRDAARRAAGAGFHEIHIEAPLATCEQRDPKGLYRRARAGGIADFTGISAPYEPPLAPELVIHTARQSIGESVAEALAYIERHFAL